MNGVEIVVPTHVGVNRWREHLVYTEGGGPHARGGEPNMPSRKIAGIAWSPRTWG